MTLSVNLIYLVKMTPACPDQVIVSGNGRNGTNAMFALDLRYSTVPKPQDIEVIPSIHHGLCSSHLS